MDKVLDSDGVNTTRFHVDVDEYVIENRQDVEPILEWNKAQQNMSDGYTPSREMRKRASIPLVIWERWLQEGMGKMAKYERDKFIRKKLADPENRFFLTHGGNTGHLGYGWKTEYKPKKITDA